MQVIEHQYGYRSLFHAKRSYICIILSEDVFETRLRSHLGAHGIDYLIQSNAYETTLPFRDIDLEWIFCFVAKRIGCTQDVLQLKDDQIYVVLWNRRYPPLFRQHVHVDVVDNLCSILLSF
jgi:hypothetical protein